MMRFRSQARLRLEREVASLKRRLAELQDTPSWEKQSAARDAEMLKQLWERHSKVRVTIEPGFGATSRDAVACESCNRYWPCPDAQILLRRGQVEPDKSAIWLPLRLERIKPKVEPAP